MPFIALNRLLRIRQRRLGRGFTLTEVMVVVAISGVILAIAVPSLTGLLTRRQLNDQTAAFTRSLNLARSAAVKHGRVVTMCRSDAPEAPAPTCDAHTGNWATGWLIFVDEDDDGVVDVTDTILRVQPGWTNGGTITSSANNRLRYRPNGLTIGLLQTFTFTPENSAQADLKKEVAINFSGRWRWSS